MPDQPMKKLTIQVDSRSAAVLLKSWKEKLAELEAEAQGLRGQIETLQGQLGMAGLPGETRTRMRAPKGQNRTIIMDYLSAEGPKRTNQIADALGLKVSSVSSVLQGDKHRFVNKAGLWSLMAETGIPTPDGLSVSLVQIRVRTSALPTPLVVPRQQAGVSLPGLK